MKKNFHLFQNLLSFFYPRLCITCETPLQRNESFFCLHCLHNLPETNYHLQKENPLNEIFSGRVKVKNTVSFLFYRKGTGVQNILHHLKYKGNKEIGYFLGKMYGEKLIIEESFQDIDLIIPIPLHKKKEKKRGYNQSEWIAKGLSDGMKIPYNSNALVRKDYTDTQTKKSRFNRWQNVKDVFQIIDADLLKGKHILLCDDVLTTGATMEAAIQKLIEIENITVSVATLAIAH